MSRQAAIREAEDALARELARAPVISLLRTFEAVGWSTDRQAMALKEMGLAAGRVARLKRQQAREERRA